VLDHHQRPLPPKTYQSTRVQYINMLSAHFLFILAVAATAVAGIQPIPSNITLADNPFPPFPSTNVSGIANTQLKLSTVASGSCGIHIWQSKCVNEESIMIRAVIENKDIMVTGFCGTYSCEWPLVGLGDHLVSYRHSNDVLEFR